MISPAFNRELRISASGKGQLQSPFGVNETYIQTYIIEDVVEINGSTLSRHIHRC